MATHSRTALLIFAKPPEPGRVKTRLHTVLSPAEAAAVHRACLEDTVRHVACVPGCQRWLQVAAPADRATELAAALGLDSCWRVGVQRGRNLGERLRFAFEARFRAGCTKVLAVGTDTPWMGSGRIRRAIELLSDDDAVLGPCADGGYYLVGVRRQASEIFSGIPWSTSQVFDRTLGALQKVRASYRLLPRDFDLDRPEDLGRAAELLGQDATRAPALARLLKKMKGDAVSRSSRRR